MIQLKQLIEDLIEENSCIYCGSIVDENLRQWFGKGGKGSAGVRKAAYRVSQLNITINTIYYLINLFH